MANYMNFQWRVTKYNPAFRDENGYYTQMEEWTCPSEIGKIINGREFTMSEYLQAETAYIDSVIKFIEESGIESLRVLQLQFTIFEEDKTSPLYEKEFETLVLKEDTMVNKNDIRLICKMVLRNFIWCQLYSKNNFFVHFGWDYYMYIGSKVNCPSAIEFASNNGLFVEQCTSPYFISEKDTTRQIQWSEVGDKTKLIVGEEELKNVPLNEYQRIFNLTKDHPVIGSFSINKDQINFFQPLLNHRMDFDKYEYSFWGGY